MATSASSRNSKLRRTSLSKPDFYNFTDHEDGITSLSKPDFYNFTDHEDGINLDDGLLRNAYGGAVEAQSTKAEAPAPATESTFLNAGINLLDAAAAIEPIAEAERSPPLRKRTAEEVWREIMAGKVSKPPRRVECKEEAMDEMMTLEDFLVKAGAVEEPAVAGTAEGEVKVEALAASGPSEGMLAFVNPYMARQGSLDSMAMGYGSNGSGGIGGGRGKRRALSLLEPMDKAAAQRQRRMIKNRESAARSRERKQAYQVELEAMALKLEEEHELLLKEKADRVKERCKLLLQNVIPVEEKRRPARTLRRVRSMEW